MIKAIMFDNGNVVRTNVDKEYREYMSKKVGITVKKMIEIFLPHEHMLDRGFITRRKFWQLVCKDLNMKFDSSLVGMLYKVENKFFKINKPVMNLAKKLKKTGYLIPMLSNTIGPHARVSREHNIYKHFHPVMLSHEIHMRKPNKNIYEYALRKVKLKAEECVFVDDLKENMKIPKKLGIHTIVFKNYTQLRKELTRLGVKV